MPPAKQTPTKAKKLPLDSNRGGKPASATGPKDSARKAKSATKKKTIKPKPDGTSIPEHEPIAEELGDTEAETAATVEAQSTAISAPAAPDDAAPDADSKSQPSAEAVDAREAPAEELAAAGPSSAPPSGTVLETQVTSTHETTSVPEADAAPGALPAVDEGNLLQRERRRVAEHIAAEQAAAEKVTITPLSEQHPAAVQIVPTDGIVQAYVRLKPVAGGSGGSVALQIELKLVPDIS
mmetsp:Transcript_16408/g.42105  ORF Transcript_16408/g.42105 Transcript_16408/m.42105 type:complete len:238 (-) Transcript_16408:233-946(-)